MSADYKKWMKQTIKAAEAAGWTVVIQKSGHVALLAPESIRDHEGRKVIVVLSGTPSDHRGRKNAEALLRRYGL